MDTLMSLLGAIEDATSIVPQAFLTDRYGEELPAITYSYYRASDDGAVARWRLQTRVHARTYQECIEIEAKLASALVTLGDSTQFGCSISSNGGGTLVDEEADVPQLLTYFDITKRSQ